MDHIDNSDRREHARVPCEIQVRIEGIAQDVAVTARDLSVGGLFLFTRRPEPLNRDLAVEFIVDETRITTRGRVVHCISNVGFGIRFDPMNVGDISAILRFIGDAGGLSSGAACAEDELVSTGT